MNNISELKGQILIKITGMHIGSAEIVFYLQDGRKFKLYHIQDCCEHVSIEEVIGNPNDLISSRLAMSEEVSNYSALEPPNVDSFTWTFYKFATIKGYVTVRWLGESNGYYSESVDFEEIKSK